MLGEIKDNESYIEENADILWKMVTLRETYGADFR
jgi:hypothetical protein